eukprot:6278098-Amphidinium_carterae.1
MELLARAIPSASLLFMDNTSEPATVLPMNQTLSVFGFVDDYAPLCPIIDVSEPATTIDDIWTTMCDSRCSMLRTMHQLIDNLSSSPSQEIDMYHFDASHLAWSIGRLGLHSRFIVASTNNGSSLLEEPPLVNLGVTFEFLLLPHLCAQRRLELANPDYIEVMQ